MDAEEYDVMRRETEEELSEVRASLARMQSGDMTLVNERNESQLVSAHMYAHAHTLVLSWQPPTHTHIHTHTPARTHAIRKRVKAKKIRVGLRVSVPLSFTLLLCTTPRPFLSILYLRTTLFSGVLSLLSPSPLSGSLYHCALLLPFKR